MYKLFVLGLALVSLVNVSFAMTPVEFGKSVGANENLINELRDACQSAKDQQHCFGVGLSISNAESSLGNGKTYHGYFGLVGSKGDKSPKDRVTRYNRKRYKATSGFFFYGDRGVLGPSRYCTSEDSSGSKVGCPAGRKNFDSIYNDYKIKVGSKLYTPPLDEGIQEQTHKPECTFVGIVPEGGYIQTDSLIGKLLEIIRPKNKTRQKLFICSNQ